MKPKKKVAKKIAKTKPHWTRGLERMHACRPAIQWAKKYSTFQRAWDQCENAEWMRWYLFHRYYEVWYAMMNNVADQSPERIRNLIPEVPKRVAP